MTRRASPATLAALVAVQRVRVLVADAALADARTGEADARTAEDRARAATADAHLAWLDQLDRPTFAPEVARALAADLLARDRDEAVAAGRTRIAAGLHDRRRDDWRLADARAEATGEAHADARRTERRRRDERAALAAGDRVSRRWSDR